MIPRVLLCLAIFASIASSAFSEEDEHLDHPDFSEMEPEMRAKWNKQKRNQCKTYKELTCAKKTNCPVANRKTKKKCGHPKDYTCCAKCENLAGFGCSPKSQCKEEDKRGAFWCPKNGHTCCRLEEVKYNMKCEEPWQCADDGNFCNLETGKCDCDKGFVPQKGKCVEACGTFGDYSGFKLIAFPGKVTRDQAMAKCKYEGARLPVVKDAAMNDAITGAMEASGMSDSDWVWLGLMPSKTKYKYMWEDMSTLMVNEADGAASDGTTYTNFNPIRAYDNALGEDCYIMTSSTHSWEDIECGRKEEVATVCECMPTD